MGWLAALAAVLVDHRGQRVGARRACELEPVRGGDVDDVDAAVTGCGHGGEGEQAGAALAPGLCDVPADDGVAM